MRALLEDLSAVLGPGGVLTGAEAVEKAFTPWGQLGQPLAVLRPCDTQHVAAALAIAGKHGVAVTAWGGKTGLVDGAYAEGILALSLERMNAVQNVDACAATMTVQAGCVLEAACDAAAAAGLLLPLDMGSRGSATVGGAIATNAGGNRVLRFGMMRDMLLGVEAVLADGRVICAMKPLLKNNTGYDLRHVFCGSEGTLGIVTRAVLRLRPAPVSQNTALVAVPDFARLPKLLRHMEARLGGMLSAFEVMWPAFYELVTTAPAQGQPILPHGHAFYVLIEAMGSDVADDGARFERVLSDAMAGGLVEDAVLAKSQSEARRIWALRDDVGQMARLWPFFTFDVSLRVADMEDYLAEVGATLHARWPGAPLVVFGHLGDGNLHLVTGVGDEGARHCVEAIVYGPLARIGGSISAEHGIGLQKRAYLCHSRSPEEIDLMRAMKQAFDPRGLLNPGKVVLVN